MMTFLLWVVKVKETSEKVIKFSALEEAPDSLKLKWKDKNWDLFNARWNIKPNLQTTSFIDPRGNI